MASSLCPNCPGPRVPHHCGKVTLAGKLGLGKGAGCRAPPRPAAAPATRPEQVFLVRRGEVDPAFPLRGRMLGERGSNVKSICERTGARISLEGCAANPQDGSEPMDSDIIMRVRIFSCKGADTAAAAKLVRELLDRIRSEHDDWVAQRQRRKEGKVGRTFEVLAADSDPRFPWRQTVLGEDGENLRYICKETGARIVLEGQGDGRSPAAPRLRITGDRGADLEAAEELTRELLEYVQQEHDEWVAARASSRRPSGGAASSSRPSSGSQGGLQVPAPPAPVAARPRPRGPAARPASSGVGRVAGFCALFPLGACPYGEGSCPRGQHGEPPASEESEVLVRITRAKRRLIQQKWADAGGSGEIINAWQVRNPRLEFLFRASECDFAAALGHGSDTIDGWHGTREENVLSIATHGFDPRRRCGQVFGAGEYFAKDPNVSVGYAQGGAFMFLCKLLLGEEDKDHTWVDDCKYYVLKQRECRVQALPLYVVQFQESPGQLAQQLDAIENHDTEEAGILACRQRGGLRPCEGRRDAGMTAASTRHLWVGWLAPELCGKDDDAVAADVEAFLRGHRVEQVVPERNGARIGAFVLLAEPVDRAAFELLCRRRYRGEYRITVDDQQPGNPRCVGKVCPRLTGPSHYCRGWNLRGHHAWQWGCPFEHPEARWPTHGARYRLEAVRSGSAKHDEIETELLQSAPFTSADGTYGTPRIVSVSRVVNKDLERLYEERRGFLRDKHGFIVEKELWHGTNCKALPELLTHGLQPPSDTQPSDACPRSGGKGLCTTLCGSGCRHCRQPHCWDRCHMYGLGVYLADLAQKSHRYVREPGTGAAAPREPKRTFAWQTVLAGQWRDFDEKLQRDFEAASTAGRSSYEFSARSWPYRLDLDRMVQINLSTGRERQVRRLDAGRAGAPQEGDESGEEGDSGARPVYSMLRCRVILGNPYLIEGNLLQGDAMHGMCWCQNPADSVESSAQDWCIGKGHDAYYVRGLAGWQKAGLGVFNSEYIVFQPYQILPLYQVDYVLEE